MIDIQRSGSFDAEPDEMRNHAIAWVLKMYGPTAVQRRVGCGCPSCCVLRDEASADRAAFMSHVELLRDGYLAPAPRFYDTGWQ